MDLRIRSCEYDDEVFTFVYLLFGGCADGPAQVLASRRRLLDCSEAVSAAVQGHDRQHGREVGATAFVTS